MYQAVHSKASAVADAIKRLYTDCPNDAKISPPVTGGVVAITPNGYADNSASEPSQEVGEAGSFA